MVVWTIRRQLLVLCCLAVTTAPVFSSASTDEESGILPAGVTVIQAEGLIRLARIYDDLIIIDSRSPVDRKIGYIEGSVALPDNQTTCETLAKTNKNLVRPMVFYCNGIKCTRSHRALQLASSCGYSQLYWFKGGYEEWREKRLPVLGSH